MGIIETVSGVTASPQNTLGILLPVTAGLEGWFFPGGSAAASVKDYASIANAVAVGTPTYNNGYASFPAQGDYLQTSVEESAAQSILCVARTPDTFSTTSDGPVVTHNFGADPTDTTYNGSRGTILNFSETSSVFRLNATSYVESPPSTLAGWATSNALTLPKINAFGFYAYTIDASGNYTLTSTTGGATATTSQILTRSINQTTRYIIGLSPALSIYIGQTDVAFIAYYNRALASTEISAIYAFVQNYLSKKFSITI